MKSASIPEQLQIDAALTSRLWNLVHRFCEGAWRDLAINWTVSLEDIVAEAKLRGLETFVSDRPVSEGFWLLSTGSGYVVFYMERGARMYHEEFMHIEPAFRYWLEQELRSHLLPTNAEPNSI